MFGAPTCGDALTPMISNDNPPTCGGLFCKRTANVTTAANAVLRRNRHMSYRCVEGAP